MQQCVPPYGENETKINNKRVLTADSPVLIAHGSAPYCELKKEVMDARLRIGDLLDLIWISWRPIPGDIPCQASRISSLAWRVRSAYSELSRPVIGPELPSPIMRPSISTTAASSPMVPVQNTSSAR